VAPGGRSGEPVARGAARYARAVGEGEVAPAAAPATGTPPPRREPDADHDVLDVDFGPRELLAAVFATYRRHFWRVAVPAVVVFGAAAVADAYGLRTIDRAKSSAATVASVVVIAVLALGETFYTGLLDGLVGRTERGHDPPKVLQVLRTLPYLRLIVADFVLTTVTGAAAVFLVVPGVVVFTLFGLVGPLINMEGLGVVSGFSRSFQLVRRRFTMTLGMVTLPLIVEHEVVDLVGEATHDTSVLTIFLASAAVGAAVSSVVGLLTVFMAERLSRAYPPAS